ncbi:hypothetical protein EYF80_058728 [Liparis tanakae]|uniref:Uncharacterized protein n=1 Tax=Liparis tanakae TaxID=230148 RepID=A0A4Z2ERA7_9TELE|nr:hypothetical protein EYF80_058728 [Liparis tanakae]
MLHISVALRFLQEAAQIRSARDQNRIRSARQQNRINEPRQPTEHSPNSLRSFGGRNRIYVAHKDPRAAQRVDRVPKGIRDIKIT